MCSEELLLDKIQTRRIERTQRTLLEVALVDIARVRDRHEAASENAETQRLLLQCQVTGLQGEP